MRTEHPIIKAMSLLDTGDKAFDAGDYSRALACFDEAVTLARQAPPAARWDQSAFLATCQSRRSGSLGRLGRTAESLQAAEEAVEFFDRLGHMYPAERNQWFNARFNRGAALAELGRSDEAIRFLTEARSMLSDDPDAARLRALCDQNIDAIGAALAQRASKPSKKRGTQLRPARQSTSAQQIAPTRNPPREASRRSTELIIGGVVLAVVLVAVISWFLATPAGPRPQVLDQPPPLATSPADGATVRQRLRSPN